MKILSFLNRGIVLDWAYSVRLVHPSPSLEPSAAFRSWIEKLAKASRLKQRGVKMKTQSKKLLNLYYVCSL